MCDYSLMHLSSRPAVEQDRVTTHDFDAGTTGFRPTDDANGPAVCVLPGAEIAFSQPPHVDYLSQYQAKVNGQTRTVGLKNQPTNRVATFIQVDKHEPNKHHDALQFADGSIVMLNDLTPGQDAVVISLPAVAQTEIEQEFQRRAEFV